MVGKFIGVAKGISIKYVIVAANMDENISLHYFPPDGLINL